jgi:uncharacterized protein YfkK (UPF0435 family)
MTYETRIEMKLDLTEISISRRDTADFITKCLLENFTARELALIAEELQKGRGVRLLELIKR